MKQAGSLYAVIPAAGSGSRMNSSTPKQYIEINGMSVLTHTVDRLLQIELIEKIVVVLDEATYNDSSFVLPDHSKINTCVGGSSRAESVSNGLYYLQTVAPPDSMVLVHDAARPCVRVGDIMQLIDTVGGDINGGLLGMPVVDTLKRVGKDMQVTATVDRDELWRAATPQLFQLTALLNALTTALEQGVDITDEASAMQYAGFCPRLLQCSADNIKVTTPTDLALATHYLSAQQSESV